MSAVVRVPRPRRPLAGPTGRPGRRRGGPDRTPERVVVAHALAAVGMSLPWPLLLLEVSERSSQGWVLGLAAAARMVPYVAVSWAAGRIGDRVRRDRLVRITLAGRVLLLGATGFALAIGDVLLAVVLATLAVAVATPAFPAVAAGMPGLAGPRSERLTGVLVTVEVASFVVGPAIGGLMLVPVLKPATVPVSVALVVLAWCVLAGVRIPAPRRPAVEEQVRRQPLWRNAPAVRAVATAGLVNVVLGGTAVSLVVLAAQAWDSPEVGYGLTTAALGFGAVGGPLVGLLVLAVCRPGWSRGGVGLVLTGVPVATLAVAPDHVWAMAPLVLVGAAATYVEAEATADIQRAVPDDERAGVLGVTDTVIVTAMMIGSFAAPLVASVIGYRWLVVLLGAICLLGVGRSRSGGPGRPGPGEPLVIDLREGAQGALGAAAPDVPQQGVPEQGVPERGQRRERATRTATSSRTSTSPQLSSSASLS